MSDQCLFYSIIISELVFNILCIIKEKIRDRSLVQHHISILCKVTQLLCNINVPSVSLVENFVQPTKSADFVLIKDSRNGTALAQGVEIINKVGYSLSSDIPTTDVGAPLSFSPSTSVHSRLLVLVGYLLILKLQLVEIIYNWIVHNIRINKIEVGIIPYVIDEI